MDYQTSYNKQELKDLIDWFEAHHDNLPQSFRMSDALNFPDLPHTVDHIVNFLKMGKAEATFSGQIYTWFVLRDKLIAAGF